MNDSFTKFNRQMKVSNLGFLSSLTYCISLLRLLSFFTLVLIATSCNSTKFLKEGKYLVDKNNIELSSKHQINNHRKLKYELAFLYKQKENTNFLFFFPRERFYFKRQSPADTSAFDRFVRKHIAETPTIFSDSLTQLTANSMKYFLHHKGYYYANVDIQTKKKRKKIKVKYIVTPGVQFKIDSIFFNSPDPNIDSVLNKISGDSHFKKGEGFDLSLFDAEKKRVTDHLNNTGYAFFHNGHIDKLDVDTFQNNQKANIYFNILPPPNHDTHSKYKIGSIEIYADYNPTKSKSELHDTIIEGYHFLNSKADFIIKPAAILRSIYFKSGEYFHQKKKTQTNKQLSELGIYRFIRIKETIDSIHPNLLNIRIELSPSLKMEGGWDFELNYTNSNSSTSPANLIGVSFKPSFKNRNLFQGAELLTVDVDLGVEISPFEKNRRLNTIDASVQTNLYLPKFLDYFGFWRGLHNIPWGKKRQVLNTDFFNAMKESSSTKISAAYTYQQITDWYRTHLFSASYGYDLRRSPTQRYIINHIGIDYFDPIPEEKFITDILNKNPFWKRSFGQQVFISLLFKNLDFIYTSRPNRFGEATYVGLSFELAGAEIWGINALYNELSLDPKIFKLGSNIDFSQYLKFETELRYSQKFNKKQQIASRLNIGIAQTFGFTTDVPYVKQFSSGGANSIRAWLPRGLGPGGYLDSLSTSTENRNRLYQKGDLRFEFNLEYRFNVVSIFNLAVFIDGGNIWTSKLDTTRYGSQFLFKRKCVSCGNATPNQWNDAFYQQIALGGGLGLRFDVSYFVFRLDIGFKLRNPYPATRDENGIGSNYWQNSLEKILENPTFNFGLGYPF